MSTLFLDAGHTAGKDPGACANGTTEHGEMSALVGKLGHPTIPTSLLLPGKIRWINKRARPEDVLVSFHMNSGAPSTSGIEVYYYGGSLDSKKRAEALLENLTARIPLPSRGVKPDTATRHGRLGIVRDTTPWAFLVELGFLTNAADVACVRASAAAVVEALRTWMADTFR